MNKYLINQLQYCGNKALLSTCQLFYRAKAIGSGVLLSVKGNDYLVSAAHVLEIEFIRLMTIPNGEILVEIQGELKITQVPLNKTRDDDKIDIAIVKLSKSCSDELKKRFIFLDENQIDYHHLELDSHQYFFCGYPIQNTEVRNMEMEIFPIPLKVRTKITKKDLFETPDYDNGTKWILEYDRRNQLNISKKEKQISPHLKGISGGGLWSIPYNQKIKVEDTEIKLVGIMTDYFELQDGVVGATNVSLVQSIIKNKFEK